MSVVIVTHPRFADHDTGDHPERPARYTSAASALADLTVEFVEPAMVTTEALLRVHPAEHAARIQAFCQAGGGRLDEDTVASTESYDVARLSAGAAVAAVELVLGGATRAAVAPCRPPGHHALANETMGFCFFNNAAVAARHAQAAYGLERVAIIDWDLHHGNGTEAIFYDDPTVLYLSMHQDPNWPGTGAATDIGTGAGKGFTVNVPLPMGTGDVGSLRAFREVFEPVIDAFKPELIIISAGFDAHWRDPLGRLGLTVAGFSALTREVQAWAERHTQGRLVALMEGGYDLEALGASMRAMVDVLRGASPQDALGPSPYAEPLGAISRTIAATRQALAPYWPGSFTALPQPGPLSE